MSNVFSLSQSPSGCLSPGETPEWEHLLSADKTSKLKIWLECKASSSACSTWVPWVACFSKSCYFYSLPWEEEVTTEGLMIPCKQIRYLQNQHRDCTYPHYFFFLTSVFMTLDLFASILIRVAMIIWFYTWLWDPWMEKTHPLHLQTFITKNSLCVFLHYTKKRNWKVLSQKPVPWSLSIWSTKRQTWRCLEVVHVLLVVVLWCGGLFHIFLLFLNG